jgi:hypothetical protein
MNMAKRAKQRPKNRHAAPVDAVGMMDDPVVEEVRRVREKIFAKFNYNLKAMGKDLMRRQAKARGR